MHVRTICLDLSLSPICVDVAGAGAILELSGRVEHRHRLQDLWMRLRAKAICVTGGTTRLVSRKFPHHHLRVCDVAGAARNRRRVIWIERRPMPIENEAPGRRTVTGFALQIGCEVPRSWPRRRSAIVAGRASSRQTTMVHARACE